MSHILPAIHKVDSEHCVRIQDFYQLAVSSSFVPAGREVTFAKGFYAGFTGGLIESTHLLIPQIEESIRAQLGVRGVTVSGFNRQNQQNEWNLNVTLYLEETRLVRLRLGTAPGQDKQALDQSATFKRQLRFVLPAVEGASLLTVSDHGTMWVEAVYDAHLPGTECWAKRAAELAPKMWATLAKRRAVRTK